MEKEKTGGIRREQGPMGEDEADTLFWERHKDEKRVSLEEVLKESGHGSGDVKRRGGKEKGGAERG